MNLKKILFFIIIIGLVTVTVYAQSAKPRAGQYLFESSTERHWVRIIDQGDDRFTIEIVSTNRGLGNGVRITGAYWRSGSGAIEFEYNGRTVQIRAARGGRSITCSLFGSVILDRD